MKVGAFRIPTETPESDGTLQWSSTTLVVVELAAADLRGIGFTYAEAAVGTLIRDALAPVAIGRSAWDIAALGEAMAARLRNGGREGASAMAVSAMDVALWDLKAKSLDLPLARLFGQVRDALPAYGSGGFTSYSDEQLERQFSEWTSLGFTRFKMKFGREPGRDPQRFAAARRAVGAGAELFADANSAFGRREALQWAERLAANWGVTWFEQPLVPYDLDGLLFLRDRSPASLEIADGEYGYTGDYFRRLLEAGAVDVVMADATRCGGFTGFLKAAALCEVWAMPLSSHCAPALHLAVGCAAKPMRHAEYFFDHARIERLLFDGCAIPEGGVLRPDLSRPGLGLEFKWADAERYQA